jgi:hypothetical protein
MGLSLREQFNQFQLISVPNERELRPYLVAVFLIFEGQLHFKIALNSIRHRWVDDNNEYYCLSLNNCFILSRSYKTF